MLSCDKPAENHARIQRVRRDVTVFIARIDWPPIMKIQRAVLAAAWCCHGIAVLLRAIHPVRKLGIRYHVIELPCWLVEPRAPRLTAVARYDRALVTAQNHPPRLIRINPQFVIVVAARCASERRERFPSVMRFVRRGVRNVYRVRVFRIHADFPEIPSALPDTPVIRNALPALPRVIRTKQPTFLCVHDQINSPRIARRKRYANSSQSFRRQSLPVHAFPMIAPVNRAIQPAARSIRGRVDAPRRPSRLPQRCVNRSWIPRFERQINRARVFVMKQNFLPTLSAIFRAEHPSLLVRTVRMPQRGDDNLVYVSRVP